MSINLRDTYASDGWALMLEPGELVQEDDVLIDAAGATALAVRGGNVGFIGHPAPAGMSIFRVVVDPNWMNEPDDPMYEPNGAWNKWGKE